MRCCIDFQAFWESAHGLQHATELLDGLGTVLSAYTAELTAQVRLLYKQTDQALKYNR